MLQSTPTEVLTGAPRHVFVYGTLRKGEANDINRLKPPPVFVGGAVISGSLYRLDWYPGIVLGGAGRVTGEVYAICPELEQRLDEIEGLLPDPTGEYEKREIAVEVAGGSMQCLVYEINPSLLEGRAQMDGGDWLLRMPL